MPCTVVVQQGVAELLASLHERSRHRCVETGVINADRALRAVVGGVVPVLGYHHVLQPLEVLQHVVVRPSTVPHPGPVVVIPLVAPRCDHEVDHATAAHYFPLGERALAPDHPPAVILGRFRLVHPVEAWYPLEKVRQQGYVHVELLLEPCLDQKNG